MLKPPTPGRPHESIRAGKQNPGITRGSLRLAQKGKTNMKNMASQTQPVKTYSVQSQIGALFLMFDNNGDRWTSLLNISITTGIGLARLDSKADARYWKCEHFPGIGYCIPVPKLQEFLNSIPKSWVLVTREFEFSWVLTHAARVLAGFTPKTEQAVTPLLPEVVEAPKLNLPIHAMPMPEVRAAPVADLLPIRTLPLGEEQVNSVSARDLHAFLEVGKVFGAWINERIEAYEFQEHRDFEVFSESGNNPQGGRPAKEYLLTLDMAKELAMVERNEKGKQARQYFLECERKVKSAMVTQKPMSSLEILVAQSQALLDQDRKIEALATKVDAITAAREQSIKTLEAMPEAEVSVPSVTTRLFVNRVVREYCLANDYGFPDAWNRLFLEFRDRYHVDLKARATHAKAKPLDIAEEEELMDELYALALSLFGKAVA